ncbi:MAG TPA: hypothetical protein VFC21_09670 [Bryobacteraceae bacterium]|nr:hypothetical protein [Bryobacteraceae bacterium]
MKILREALLCVLILVAIAVGLRVCAVIPDTRPAIAQLTPVLTNLQATAGTLNKTLADLDSTAVALNTTAGNVKAALSPDALATIRTNVEDITSNAAIAASDLQTKTIPGIAEIVDSLKNPVAEISQSLTTINRNHLVEKGNGAAWPVKITAMFGEYTTMSDSVRRTAAAVQKLVEEEGHPTAEAVRKSAESVAQIGGAWAGISKALEKWVDRLTAPQSVKDQIKEWIRVVILAGSHAL